MPRPSFILLLLLVLSACHPANSEAEIVLDDPWIRETPPGRDVAAGYLRLRNNSGEDRALIAASSPRATRVELHTMEHEDGMMRMRQVDQVALPAGSAVELAPGGLHLMLFDIESAQAGERIPVTLRFDDGWTIEADFPVRRDHGGGHGHHH